jgi:O-acetyl-ADP-ribose deacetylase (regulator of RNase III)
MINVTNIHNGDILEANVDALVNPVNCVGVMGKGLALQFKQKYPDMFTTYRESCDRKEIIPGTMDVHSVGTRPRFVINFPTKRHWRDKSKFDDIANGIVGLIEVISRMEIDSIAIPPLGCGLGGLDWGHVEPLIRAVAMECVGTDVVIYHPAPIESDA